MKQAWALAALLLAAYVWSYYAPPPGVRMLQTSLERFRVDALLQRQPLVVEDRVADWRELERAWFRTNFVAYAAAPAAAWTRARSKYVLLQPRADAEVLLAHPGVAAADGAPAPDAHLVAVPLRAHQVLVVPFRYWLYTDSPEVDVMAVDDLLTKILPV